MIVVEKDFCHNHQIIVMHSKETRVKQIGLLAVMVFLVSACFPSGSTNSPAPTETLIDPTKIPDEEILPESNPEIAEQKDSNSNSFLPIVTEFASHEELRYSDDQDPDHIMGAWLPKGDGPFPAIVLIHGGGWEKGNYINLRGWGQYYASRGIASFSIGYQKSTPEEPSWPATIQDVVCALRHIKSNAEFYRIDPDRIAAMGISAGGHLASFLGTLQGNEPFLEGACGDQIFDGRIQLVINISGPGDLVILAGSRVGAIPFVIQFLGGTYATNPELWHEASPYTYASSDDAIFVIGHGSLDMVVPQESADSFVSFLEEEGIETHYILFEDEDHVGEIPNLLRPVVEPLLLRLLQP